MSESKFDVSLSKEQVRLLKRIKRGFRIDETGDYHVLRKAHLVKGHYSDLGRDSAGDPIDARLSGAEITALGLEYLKSRRNHTAKVIGEVIVIIATVSGSVFAALQLFLDK